MLLTSSLEICTQLGHYRNQKTHDYTVKFLHLWPFVNAKKSAVSGFSPLSCVLNKEQLRIEGGQYGAMSAIFIVKRLIVRKRAADLEN